MDDDRHFATAPRFGGLYRTSVPQPPDSDSVSWEEEYGPGSHPTQPRIDAAKDSSGAWTVVENSSTRVEEIPPPPPFEQVDYESIGAEIGRLVTDKQAAYGNSFGRSGDILRILYPNGLDTADYDSVLTVARVIDKLFRIATDKDAFGESPWRDIAGYALLEVSKHGYCKE